MFAARIILKVVAILVLGIFLFVVGLSVSMGMARNMDGMMTPCPFMQDNGAICPMSLAVHIAEWQQLSTAQPTKISVTTLVFVLFVFTIYAVFREIRPLLLFERLRKKNLQVKIFDPLSLAFSRGILHSRLFA